MNMCESLNCESTVLAADNGPETIRRIDEATHKNSTLPLKI